MAELQTEGLPSAILLMGPTASGKTALSIGLAKALRGEIISVDSALVYRGMDIGTAKPDKEERAGIPHHLIDILDPTESFSAGQFRSQALELIADIHQRGGVPIVAGGTMLYFHALLHGMAELPSADPEIRQQLDRISSEKGTAYLHQQLAQIDPEAAARIHPNDPQRIQRALEVFHVSGQTQTDWLKSQPRESLPFHPIKLIVEPDDRAVLHQRIAERFDLMLEQGLIEEVQALYDRGDLNPQLPAIRAVGYRQVWQYLAQEITFEAMRERAIIATRQLAKRQLTWLRKQTDAKRLDAESEQLLAQALSLIKLAT